MTAAPVTTLKGWGHPRKSPARRWTEFCGPGGMAYLTSRRGWLDHLYRERGVGGTVYMAEPYNISTEDLHDLLALEDDGWQVTIDGLGSHDPATIRIRIQR